MSAVLSGRHQNAEQMQTSHRRGCDLGMAFFRAFGRLHPAEKWFACCDSAERFGCSLLRDQHRALGASQVGRKVGAGKDQGLVNGCNRKVVRLSAIAGSEPQRQMECGHRELVDHAPAVSDQEFIGFKE